MAERVCGQCGQALRTAAKFCGTCGAPTEGGAAPAGAPGAVREFEAHLAATLEEGTPLEALLDDLQAEAAALGIGREAALGLIEAAYAAAGASGPVAVRLWYDAERAGTGVVEGNTLLAIRVENRSERALQRVRVTVMHPQTQDLVGLPEITTLNKGQTKETDADLVFTRAGRQAIRVGWVDVQWLTGAREVYRLTDVVQLRVETAGAARTTIQSISQTIQTHGGGVVSAGGLTGGELAGGASAAWQEVRLRRSSAEDLQQAEQLAAARAAAAAPAVAPAVRPVPAAPSGLLAVPTSGTSVQLTWADNAADERGVYVERSSDGGPFVRLATVGVDTTVYLVSGLKPSQAYTFRLQAFNDAGVSDYSNVAAVLMPAEVAAPAPAPAEAVAGGRPASVRETETTEALHAAARAVADAAALQAVAELGRLGAANPREQAGGLLLIKVLANQYVDFSGRTSRRDHWVCVFQLSVATVILALFLIPLEEAVGVPFVDWIAAGLLLLAMPALIGLSIRRLHDTGRSGWWLGVSGLPYVGSIWLGILLCLAGEPRANQYGPDPKDHVAPQVRAA